MQQRAPTPNDTPDSQIAPPTDVLAELPPSAKLFVKTLEYNDDALTQGELAEKSLLPARTVRYALMQLEDHDLVNSRFSFADHENTTTLLPSTNYAELA